MLNSPIINKILSEMKVMKGEIDNLKIFEVPGRVPGYDGWQRDRHEPWTFVSAVTTPAPSQLFVIKNGNFTDEYNFGVKVRIFQDGITKYFYVIATSYDAGQNLTYVRVTGGSTYTLTNTTITEPYLSRQANPTGFIHWFDYTSTVAGSTGTIGTYSESQLVSRFCVVGRICNLIIKKQILNKGSWTGDMNIAYPIAKPNTGGESLSSGWVYASGGLVTAPKAVFAVESGTTSRFYKNIRTASLQWVDIAVNDWIYVNTNYEAF